MSEHSESQTHSQQLSLASAHSEPQNPVTPNNLPHSNDPNPTPRVIRLAVLHLWSMDHVKLDNLFPNIANETRGHFIGDVDPIAFMHQLLPWNINSTKAFQAFRSQKPSDARIDSLQAMATKLVENDMNREFQTALCGWPDARGAKCRNIDFEDTHNHRDSFSGLGPDASLYNRKNPIVLRKTPLKVDFANMLSFAELKLKVFSDAFIDGDREDYHGPDLDQSDWEEGGVVAGRDEDDSNLEAVEDLAEKVVDNPDDDPASEVFVAEDDRGKHADSAEDKVEFGVEPYPSPSTQYTFENDTVVGRSTRGQIASYAGVAMAMQFRSHLFSVLICGKYARFIRWDRSCAIVSRRFDYTQHPRILFNFYHRFAQLTDSQRGLLPYFKKVSEKDGLAALQVLKNYADKYFKGKGSALYKKRLQRNRLPLLRMDYKGQHYVVPAPTFDGGMFCPFGRLTRNRPIVRLLAKLADCNVMYFKDYWREHSAYTNTEAEVYDLISANETTKRSRYFGKMHAGGDAEVEGHPITTIGYDDTHMPWVKGELQIRKLTAHFIILETIGRDLKMFRSACELVTCMADAMEAHQLAYDALHILHRDISAGNILMSTTNPRHGILIDWDHCIFMDKLTKDRQTRVHRTGTWQFMSAHLTANPKGASHSLVDDRESALHVLMYLAIRYLRHNRATSMKMRDLLAMFDDYLEEDGNPYRTSTTQKEDVIRLKGPNVEFELPAINWLIKKLCRNFSALYEKDDPNVDPDDEDDEAAQAKKTRPTRLANIVKKDWLYSEFRNYAAKLPEPQPGETDYVDNTKVLRQARKRGREDDLCDETDGLKLIKTHDSMAGSINASLELSHPIETPSRKKQRSSRT